MRARVEKEEVSWQFEQWQNIKLNNQWSNWISHTNVCERCGAGRSERDSQSSLNSATSMELRQAGAVHGSEPTIKLHGGVRKNYLTN